MKLECSATNWPAVKSCDEQQPHGRSSFLWVGGDVEPRIKTAFKAPVEVSKILLEAPSGIAHRHHEAFFFDGPEVGFEEAAMDLPEARLWTLTTGQRDGVSYCRSDLHPRMLSNG